MSSILNITNGDCAVDVMKKAGIPGIFLPWRDVLHEGPVPGRLSLAALSAVRAKFIADNGWGNVEEVEHSFVERDNLLKSYKEYEKVILWFEHDLYDQLQLLQILDWFQGQALGDTALSLICTNQYLGMLKPNQLLSLFQYEMPVTGVHLELAQKAWSAFREKTPEQWCALLQEDTRALPFLADAIVRVIQEFPNKKNGLSRTEQQALTIISTGESCPERIFARNQQLEECIFLGDASFWKILQAFLGVLPPLLSLSEGTQLTLPVNADQVLRMTAVGQSVLSGETDWFDIATINRWIGGVHLTRDNRWCWGVDSDGIQLKRDAFA
jgi:hypothetical protein